MTADWPFDQSPNTAAVTTVGVLERGAPILVVQHSADDHSWTFLCGTTSDERDGRVIGMYTALRLDATLRDVADLPPGWRAERTSAGAPWQRRPDPHAAED